jgi:hypothetical protein
MLSHLTAKLELLDNEILIKKALGVIPKETKFSFEDNPEFHKHLLNVTVLAINEEKIKIQSMIDQILNQRQERDYIESLKDTPEQTNQ